jgi:Asp-tRNA(Asn)/Glu-tRNA(Gln) amidotransferase A subunit family amidase
MEETVRLLEGLGHAVEIQTLKVDGRALGEALSLTIAVDVASRLERRGVERGRPVNEDEVELVTWAMARRGREVDAMAYARARALFDATGGELGRLFETYDLVLSPTLAEPPGLLGRLGLSPADFGDYARGLGAFSPYTAIENETGVPAMSIPLHWNAAGLPIGVMFVAPYGGEPLLFSLAAQLEAAKPWIDRLPPICAA